MSTKSTLQLVTVDSVTIHIYDECSMHQEEVPFYPKLDVELGKGTTVVSIDLMKLLSCATWNR